MKKLFVLFAFLFSFGMVSAQEVLVDKIVAVVGDQAILYSEVEEQHALLTKRQGVLPDDARCVILDQLLIQRMLVVQAELDSIPLAEEEVEQQLDARIDEIMGYMGGQMDQFIAYYGKTPEEVKDEFREDLRNQLLGQRMQAKVMENISVTPKEVVAFFNTIPTDSLPYFNSEVEVQEIVIQPVPNERQLQIARDTLESVKQRIQAGADFAELAIRYSEDPGSSRRGGELGWTKRGDFVPEFEAEAYNLSKGELSQIVKSDFGFHLIQLLDRQGNRIQTRHILIKPKIEQSDLDLTKNTLDSIKGLILQDSMTFGEAVDRFSDENSQSKTNAGYLVNPKTGNSFFEIGDLPTDIYFAIDTLKVDGITSPIPIENIQTGDITFKIVKLKSRTDPHVANLKDDYSKIQTATLEQKKAVHMDTWINSTRGKIYVRLDERFKDCEVLQKWSIDKDNNIK